MRTITPDPTKSQLQYVLDLRIIRIEDAGHYPVRFHPDLAACRT